MKEIYCTLINQKKISKILQQMNGSAADAAIATMFCEGVAVPLSCGLGGGFFLTVYTKSSGKVETLNAREAAPQAATPNMFVGESQVTGIRLLLSNRKQRPVRVHNLLLMIGQ